MSQAQTIKTLIHETAHAKLHGSFEGSYYDADMGDRGENYPNGTVYLCNFSGKFTDITQVNDYTYSMTLENGELYVTAEGRRGMDRGWRTLYLDAAQRVGMGYKLPFLYSGCSSQ